MKVIDLQNAVEAPWALQHFSILPDDSTVLLNAKINNIPTVDTACIFIDGSYDPVLMSDIEIQELIAQTKKLNPQSQVVFLSSRCSDFDNNNLNVIWYPVFMLRSYGQAPTNNRSKRIGCLNRRNAPHRIWLMHNLLKQQLIDHERDIFSVSFVNVYDGKRSRLNDWISISQQDALLIAEYPDSIATVPDNFINDHSIEHPAWNTAIAVVSETEVGPLAMITEKTVKAIESQSCWILHTGQSQLNVMKLLGFEIDLFEQHATGHNIEPVVKVCQELATEDQALEYRDSKQYLIDHNAFWLKHGWLPVYLKKLNQVLNP